MAELKAHLTDVPSVFVQNWLCDIANSWVHNDAPKNGNAGYGAAR